MRLTTKTSTELKSDNELLIDIENKAKITKLMEDPFFKTHIIEALEKRLGELEAQLVWTPGSTQTTNESIALDRVWKSGLMYGISEFWRIINAIQQKGIEAEKEMGVRDKKN